MDKKKPSCPPHYWILDRNNLGHCKNCPAKQQFPNEVIEPVKNDFKMTHIDLRVNPYGWCSASSEYIRFERSVWHF